MSGNEVPADRSGSVRDGLTSGGTTGSSPANAIWLCPAVVCLTVAEMAAALYAFSDLVDDVPEPTAKVVGEELSFVVARYGTAVIESAADWIALAGADSVSAFSAEIDVEQSHRLSRDRLTWCQRQSLLLLSSESSRT